MLQSSGKRAALSPPDSGLRPKKRQERSSSPEEGELDDVDPPPSSRAPSPHFPSALGTPQPTSKYSVKVKLPFKTKVNPTADPAGATLPNNSKGVSAHHYSVCHRSEERLVADVWTSVIEQGPSKEHASSSGRAWNGHTYANDPSLRNREVLDRHQDQPPSGSSWGSPVGDIGRTGRSKGRARSRSRSTGRSSSGSRSSSRRQTHRLPPHRPRGSPPPLLSRRRDITPDSRDPRDRFNSHPHSRYDSAGSWCHDGRGQYRRDALEDYYPGDYYDSPRPPYRDYYDRGHERDPYGSRYESSRGRTVTNDYRPVSPRQPSLVRCPRSPSPCPTRTPPQPRSPPPPTPPRSASGRQTCHSTTSVPLPKKPAHMVPHSPPSMPFPPSRSPSGDGARTDVANVSLLEKVISETGEKSKKLQPPHQPPRPTRPPLRRTREEEYKAYGRTFVGSGQQDDYDAMTKLGEGTFGYVVCSSTHA